MSRYGKTETTVREFDQAGRLVSEVVTTVTERPVVERPAGFRATEPTENGDGE